MASNRIGRAFRRTGPPFAPSISAKDFPERPVDHSGESWKRWQPCLRLNDTSWGWVDWYPSTASEDPDAEASAVQELADVRSRHRDELQRLRQTLVWLAAASGALAAAEVGTAPLTGLVGLVRKQGLHSPGPWLFAVAVATALLVPFLIVLAGRTRPLSIHDLETPGRREATRKIAQRYREDYVGYLEGVAGDLPGLAREFRNWLKVYTYCRRMAERERDKDLRAEWELRATSARRWIREEETLVVTVLQAGLVYEMRWRVKRALGAIACAVAVCAAAYIGYIFCLGRAS